MLINFNQGIMGPSISCDKPCQDKFPAENIIADVGPFCLNQGFIAESFVRPPVCLVIQFPCNIIISKIIIDPCVGPHKTKKLELSTGTQLVTSSWMFHDTSDTKTPQLQNSPRRIGSITMPEPGVVCFENPKFYVSPPFSSEILSLAGEVKYRSELGSQQARSLNQVSKLILRLLQAGPTGLVALKRVEVWGQPSMRHRPDFDVCLNRFTGSIAIQQPPPISPPDSKPDKSANEQAPPAGCQVNEGDLPEIPEDFQDAITFELMAVPMLLPSGRNVDLSTLDKSRDAEAANGRLPRDPFTLVTYTHGYEPVPNYWLKARIDAFLLRHSHCKNVQNLPRTVQTLAHSSASVWRPIGKRGPSTWNEPASERKKSRLIDSDSCTSTNVSPNPSRGSGSSQSRSSALGHTPSPLQTDSREDTPDPHRLMIVMEPSPSKGSNSKHDTKTVAVTRVSRGYDTSYADQVLQQSSYTDNLLRQFNTVASRGRGSSQSRWPALGHTPSPLQTDSREDTPDPHRLEIVMEPSPSKGSNFRLRPRGSGSSQSRSSALGYTPSPLQTDSREDTPDPHRLEIVMEPSPSKGSNSKQDAKAAVVTRVSRGYDTSYADQVLQQSNTRMYRAPQFDSPLSTHSKGNNSSHADLSKTFGYQLSHNYKPLHSTSPPSYADRVGATLKSRSSHRGHKTDAASTTSPSTKPGEKERDDSVCSGCGGSDSTEGESFYLLPCKHIICRVCALGKRKQTVDGKQCGRCGVEYKASSIHRIH